MAHFALIVTLDRVRFTSFSIAFPKKYLNQLLRSDNLKFMLIQEIISFSSFEICPNFFSFLDLCMTRSQSLTAV